MPALDFQPLLHYLLLIVVVSVAGIGPAWSMTPGRWRSDRLLLLPALGLASIVLVASTANLLGAPMRVAGPLVPLVLLVWAVPLVVRHRQDIGMAIARYRWLLLGAACAGTTATWSVVLWRAWNPYNDSFTYISIADYLLQHSFAQPLTPDPGFPSTTQVSLYQRGGYRMGANYFLAFAASLLGASRTFDSYIPSLGVGIFAASLSTAAVARRVFLCSRRTSIIAGWLFGMHGGMTLATALMGFFPQTLGMPLWLAYVALQSTVLRGLRRWSLPAAAGSSLLFGTLVLTYLEGAPFAGLTALVLGAMPLLGRFSWSSVLRLGIASAVPAVVGLLLVPYTAVKVPFALTRQLGAVVGWDPQLGVVDYVFVLAGFSPWFRSEALRPGLVLTAGRAIALALPCIAFTAWSRTLPARRERLRVAGLLAAVLVFVFAAASRNPFQPMLVGQPWSTLKVVSYYWWLYPIALALATDWLLGRRWPYRAVAILLWTGLTTSSVVVAGGTARWAANSMRAVVGSEDPIGEYRKLRALAPAGTGINLLTAPELGAHRRWVAYFLDAPVITNWSDDGYIWPHLEPADRQRGVDPRLPMLVYAPNATGSVAGMSIQHTTIEFADGWFGHETDGTAVWRWLENTGAMTVVVDRDVRVVISGQLAVAGPGPRTVTLNVQGPTTARITQTFPEQWFTPVTFGPLTLPSGSYRLTLTADGLPTQLGPSDPRRIRLGFRDPAVVIMPPVDRPSPLR